MRMSHYTKTVQELIDALEKASIELDPDFKDDENFDDSEFKHQMEGIKSQLNDLEKKPVKLERFLNRMSDRMYYNALVSS